MEEVYEQLAKRNGWSYSFEGNRPYFMKKEGGYAVPDETTSEEDKQLLAAIISEGSSEMAQLILLCWDNGIIISGPCSGIREYHDEPPFSLHFAFIASKDFIDPLYNSLKDTFPTFDHMYRDKHNLIRYDISYVLKDKELSKEDSDKIFSIMREQVQSQLGSLEENKHQQLS